MASILPLFPHLTSPPSIFEAQSCAWAGSSSSRPRFTLSTQQAPQAPRNPHLRQNAQMLLFDGPPVRRSHVQVLRRHYFEEDGSGASFVHDVLRHLLDLEFFVGDSPVKALDFTMNLEWLTVGNGKSDCGDQKRKDRTLVQDLVPRVEGQG